MTKIMKENYVNSMIDLMSMSLVLTLLLTIFGAFGSLGVLGVQRAHASIETDLDIGNRGGEVTELQQFLATNPTIYPAAVVSGYFGPLTSAAVAQFQVAYDISPVGRVGPITKAKINEVMASGLGLDINAPIMSNPSMEMGRDFVVVNWNTNEYTRGQVFYDTVALSAEEGMLHAQLPYISGLSMTDNTGYRNNQSIRLQNLQPNTTYYYITRSIDNSGNVSMTPQKTFRTNM